MTASGDTRGDRYEPLPSIPRLPRWIWRRLPLPARIVVALLPLVAILLALLLAPGIDKGKDDRAQHERQRLAQGRAERAERLRAEQRPRRGRTTAIAAAGAPPAARLAGRARALGQLDDAIVRDARARGLPGPPRRVECEPYPRTVDPSGAERDLSRRSGRYECIAVTADVRPTETQGRGIIGHPYRALIDFETGRYGFCKVSGRAGEGSLGRTDPIGVPPACGGR